MRVPGGRTEKRSAWGMPVELSRLAVSLPAETTVAENVSPRGARDVRKQRWKAQVVYGESLLSRTLAIGWKPHATADGGETGVVGRATERNKRTRTRNAR